MKQYLKTYIVTLKTKGPVFIGTGNKIGKKEYVFLSRQKKVLVMDIRKMFLEIQKRGLEGEFTELVLRNGKPDLYHWLEKKGIPEKEYRSWVRYELDAGDRAEESRSELEILECMKDAYGLPYVPGSSLKGMFRTILLSGYLMKNKTELAEPIAREAERKANRKIYLSRSEKQLGVSAFHTLEREGSRKGDAINDCLSGLIVGDSQPLSTDDLTLCQKADCHRGGQTRRLNVLRESIKPECEIVFPMTVDTSILPITRQDILNAVEMFGQQYYDVFAGAFSCADFPKEPTVWLGGGSGFVSKTVLYPLLGKKQGVKTAVKIFENTNVPRVHGHHQDVAFGVSPHMIKMTQYQGKLYQMGMCTIKIEEDSRSFS